MRKSKRVLIVAGGTGGHIFPALVVAKMLRERGSEVAWLGTPRGLENRIIPENKILLYKINISGLRGKGFFSLVHAPFRIMQAFFQSISVLYSYQPDVVLGMGGFVSGPACLAACFLRKRLVIHEQNAVPGLTNKVLSYLSDVTLMGFPGAFKEGKNQYYIGNPVRSEIVKVSPPKERFKKRFGPIRLFVFGGSQGAFSFNSVIPQALMLLKGRKIEVWHQGGERYLSLAKEEYKKAGIEARVESFVDEMSLAYEWADLIICRAGASTISELSMVGVASILVPFPHAVDDHQAINARFLQEAKAAVVVSQDEFTVKTMSQLLSELTNDRDHLLEMAERARELRKEEAAQRVVCELLNLE